MDRTYQWGDARIEVGIDLRRWMLGVAWSDQDINVSFLCFYIAVDWFND